MTTVSKSVVIEAPREAIRPYFNDPQMLPKWNTNVYHWEPEEEWPNVGAKGDIGFKASGGINVEAIMTSLEYDSETLNRAYNIDGGTLPPSLWRYTFDEKDGKTTVTVDVEYTLPGSYLGQVVDKLVVERGNAKLLENSLLNLKTQVEGSG